MCGQGGHAWWGCAWQGGMRGRGRAWQVCVHGMVGGMHGVVGACMAGGMHATHTPRTLRDTVGQCAGGTHPTGMHSF